MVEFSSPPFQNAGMKNRPPDRKRPKLALAPAQQAAFDFIGRALGIGGFTSLWGAPGMGKTTVLLELHRTLGGAWVDIGDFVAAAGAGAPDGLEESFHRVLSEALRGNDLVIVDDVAHLDLAAHACGRYPRSYWWHSVFAAVVGEAQRLGRRIVLGSSHSTPRAFTQRAYACTIDKFTPRDYAALLEAFLGRAARKLDAKRIHRFAPRLDAHDFRMACQWMTAARGTFDTEEFIGYLRSQRLASNVNLDEVQPVDLRSLIGVDEVIRSLETHIALPLENDRLATEFGLRPKRGVLLYGPPGTGKTTIGRALAHRLRGKFFLIDGTFIAGSHDFYTRVAEVFEAAKQNAPAVIFIDDADAIFQNNEEQGLYRYLLTMLDGLESEGQAQVCVMMTAMELGDLPPALVRSGRVELWLGMNLPDAAAREHILAGGMAGVPAALAGADVAQLAAATDGLTGADLKRCVEDAKAIFAYAEVNGAHRASGEEYFHEAIAAIRANKELYLRARSGVQRPTAASFGISLPPGISFPPGMIERLADMGGVFPGGDPD
jgi:AAA+ superfamily predicted ATPase